MEIKYDKDADAMCIRLRKGIFCKNKKLDDFTILDLDKEGNILAIEILDVSKRTISLPECDIRLKNPISITQ